MRTRTIGLRAAGLTAAAALVLAACGGGGTGDGESPDASPEAPAATGEPVTGGTLTLLTQAEQILHLDPQRNYTGEDLAFASGYLHRTLTTWQYSTDANEANTPVPDLATDIGTPNEDASEWSFTLKDGILWEDGSPVTCEDVKYGVSRTFATDVITDGPSFAISKLDIPANKDGSSKYKGPYTGEGQELFDEAVSCDGNTITFKLNAPAPDFNQTVTLLAFAPVPESQDTGEKYDDRPFSNGPYKIEEYTPGQQLILVRNENWDPATDELRGAYPDTIEYKFAIDANLLDQRMQADAAEDQTAITPDPVLVASLATVFSDPRFEDRRTNEFDPYSRYIAINTTKVPNVLHRRAILAATDRGALIQLAGGEFAGDVADGTIKPNIGIDYAPTGLWEGLLGQAIPEEGDPEFAKQLIEESGEPMPKLVYDYATSPDADKSAVALQEALARADIEVKLNPIDPGSYYGVVLNEDQQGHMSAAGWGPDWPNASTVIPELFGVQGGFNLSRYNNPEFEERLAEAKTNLDREAQAVQWQELNTFTMEEALVLPTRFGREQRLHGSKIGGAYIWAPYGSWPYGNLWVEQ
jgi:peptide/nickel transport system substrate-binding protein